MIQPEYHQRVRVLEHTVNPAASFLSRLVDALIDGKPGVP